MPRMKIADHLNHLISKLRAEYTELTGRLGELEETFSKLGITSAGGKTAARRGRPPKAAKASAGKPGRRRKRGTFSKSGEESVVDFVKKHGKPNAAEVNKHWSGEGRGGKADNALGRMVKAGKLKRVKVKGERGARYVAA
ncbi:MAG: hypothetical protein K8S99_17005 [Planctomycetes bacterium]|nr:hypothetical protein [Planctomycetota bacterium]